MKNLQKRGSAPAVAFRDNSEDGWPMLRLRLKVLGGFEARIGDGEPLDIATRKTRALLAYLALPPGRAYARDKLTGLLWSDRGDEQARNSLRQALTELGRVLTGVEPLVRGRDTLSLDPEAVEVDAMLFERLAASPDAGDLRRAAAMYAGDLLDGFGVRDPAFEEWLRDKRTRYRELAITTLKKLVTCQTGENALAVAQRLLTLAPLQEEVHRTVMRLHADAGDIGAALHQYEVCREMLKRELDVAPSPETEALHRHIRARTNAAALVRPESGPRPILEAVGTVHPRSESSKLSIAVLPFQNLSDDTAQRYFSDGITEDIITELSRFHQLQVVARSSSFRYRGEAVEVVRVGRELGVQYVVQGSIRRLGDRIRITAQLIDSASGHHLWSERFDRSQEDIFAVQDQVVQTIVATLVGRMQVAGTERAKRKPPSSLAAYEYVLRGAALPIDDPSAEAEARLLYEKAVELDPEYARAYVSLAYSYGLEWYRDMTNSDSGLDRAFELARKAVALDESDSACHLVLGWTYQFRHSYELAEHHYLRAIELNRNSPALIASLGSLYAGLGRIEDGLRCYKDAKLMDPFFERTWYWPQLGIIHFIARRYDDAITGLSRSPTMPFWVQAYLAASYALTGKIDNARSHAAEVLRLSPHFSLIRFAGKKMFKHPEDRQHLIDGLRKAGLPE